MTSTALTKYLEQLRQSAGKRTFGLLDVRRSAAVRHGYLLALEEVEQALDEDALLATSSPRDAA